MSEFHNTHHPKEFEVMVQQEFAATRISQGLGFGDGTICGTPETPAEAALLVRADEAINSPAILIPVDVDSATGQLIDDDGCGDGREVGVVFRRTEQLKRSLNRSKVFGGGVAMASASMIGLGMSRGKTLTATFNDAIATLNAKNINYGGHTAEHVKNDHDSGCGAIDGAPEIVQHVVTFEGGIRSAVGALGINYEGVENDLDDVMDNFREAVTASSDEAYSGKTIVQTISDNGKIVKQLTGAHKERRILLNNVRGYTVNQKLVRDVSDGSVQVFATDLWRLEDLAAKLYQDDAGLQRKALLSEVVYTLGVSAYLTPGDLPIYLIEGTPVGVAA